ncbi:pyruvate dehydrogenase complex dihydrolipoamide acetyltransferase [Roseospira navarrensis]|uniref:Acetyltransferase component of pyruvate dehydrogenase complex n=1 Tax=Roseospira navarrensis TaxID=140058 RepID=A0A7X2D3E4_9PROT|nr:pyruvate dehydrogenase complex dihydrolipoamide acetyltransferase [Roseospira navarrensis]MQX37299.1 pyruvate dehydrogenase complex dihydrolipoamide acetyltransferase [Roseospira navarrensis]
MPTQILMPALSPTMEEGTLARWMKKEGDVIEAGDVICEIETDKATMDFEAVDEGVLGRILVPDGTDGVKVNQPIGLLLEEGEDQSALDDAEAKAKNDSGGDDAPAPESGGGGEPAPAPAASSGQPAPAPSGPVQPAPPAPRTSDGARVFASPLARRLAAEAGLDLTGVKGSGPHGRIVRADVDKAKAEGPKPQAAPKAAETASAEAAAPAAPQTPAAPAKAVKAQLQPWQQYHEVPNSQMRKVIGRRLVEAKQTVPHFYLTIDCALDPLLDLRRQLNEKAPKEGAGAFKLSVNDLIVKAAAVALRRVPAANAVWTDEAILMLETVDVSVAVATDRGLITPIIRDADTKGLAAIAAETKDLAQRARDGKLKPEEFQGGGFSVSNLGMYGIREFSAIINPPQSCILAVGQGEQRPVVKDGALTIATMMSCTLSVDHRSVDGAVGAEYLAAFKAIVEDPLTLLL